MSSFQLVSLFSGSTGNCLLVEGEGAKILIDCGVAIKRLSATLVERGVNPFEIDALLITHEHSDHIKGAGHFAKYYGTKVYSNQKTMEMTLKHFAKVDAPADCWSIFDNNSPFSICGLEIKAFPTSHDAADPVGFVISGGEGSIGVMTDTGCITEGAVKCLSGCASAYLEANHDIDMLKKGPYPYSLKRRILSASGHLSNADSGDFIANLIKIRLKRVMLGHLSLENNRPQLAFDTVENTCSQYGMKRRYDYILGVAPHYEASSPLFAK